MIYDSKNTYFYKFEHRHISNDHMTCQITLDFCPEVAWEIVWDLKIYFKSIVDDRIIGF